MATVKGRTKGTFNTFNIDTNNDRAKDTLSNTLKQRRNSRAQSSQTFNAAAVKRHDMFYFPTEGIVFHIAILLFYAVWAIPWLDTLWIWISYVPLALFIVLLKRGVVKNNVNFLSDLIPFRCYLLMVAAFTAGVLQKTIRLAATGCTFVMLGTWQSNDVRVKGLSPKDGLSNFSMWVSEPPLGPP